MWQRWFRRSPAPTDITIVSGLPRSGTSMMMQMLHAGGMQVMTDNVRQADSDNPKGYYEFASVKTLKHDPSALDSALGKACKVISLLLVDLPLDKSYKIIFMQRDLQEILASQRLMLQHRNKIDQTEADADEAEADMAQIFTRHLHDIRAWLAQQNNMDVLYVDYNDAMANPVACAQAVNRFLAHRLDLQRLLTAVDQSLYRNRSCKP
ncbi:MAG: sulfotransferase domain-containing protein [bacterium]|nr:sulfotransferase domain-containing protein [bacterium]